MSKVLLGLRDSLIRYSALILVLAAVLLVPAVVRNAYVLRVFILIGVYVILTSSLNLIVGYTGIYGIGHVAFYGIGAYASALLVTRVGFPVWLGMIASLPVAGVCGYAIGKLTLRLKEKLFVALVSLAFSIIVMLIFLNWTSLTNGPLGISGIPTPRFLGRPFRGLQPYFYLIVFLDALVVVTLNRLVNSRFGRALRAIREDETAATASGVDLAHYKIAAFTIAAAMAGVAGSFYSHYVRYISPDSFWFAESFVILAMLVFGGRGNIIGPIVGVVILVSLTELFRAFSDYRMIIYGTLLILTMLFRKQGLLGERDYSLLIPWPPVKKTVYAVGDRFMDQEEPGDRASS